MKTKTLIDAAVAAFLLAYASTSGAQSKSPAGAPPSPANTSGMGMMEGKCPMHVKGTKVTSADVEGGAALVFTTSTDEVAELRQRVRRMAEMHNRHQAAGGMMMGGGMMGGGRMMPAATASVEDIEDGARLVFRSKDPTKLEGLREHARTRAARMARGECPMMTPAADVPATTHSNAADSGHEAHHSTSPGK